ncbi:hypothetical protein QAD02_015119 [Eretmocerus hayati]|uniref:Uncharacterized protein n=1 Tax=Eretmocerus hayati TaxID=131215 RepID=A0ACC2PA53_9HYME|nr:hypothetical protein QAD02_015119 [Eretmocerus hayati]
MNLLSTSTLTFLWALLAVTIVALASSDYNVVQNSTLPMTAKISPIDKNDTKVDDATKSSITTTVASTNASSDDGRSKRGSTTPEKSIKQQQKPRTSRQNQNTKKQRPGFFWTIAKATYQSFNDTRSAIQQISEIINKSIPDEPPRKKKPNGNANIKKPISGGGAPAASTNNTMQVTTTEPSTSTEFKLTRPKLQSLVSRNVKGLVRLFKIEWQDAMSESRKSIQEFRKDLGNQIGIYLKDNPNNY